LGLMEGEGASEDHIAVQEAFESLGLTRTAATQIRARLCQQPAAVPPLVERMLDTLESANSGLCWYREAHPEHSSGADDEMETEIERTIKAARIYLGK